MKIVLAEGLVKVAIGYVTIFVQPILQELTSIYCRCDSVAKGTPKQAAVNMRTSRMFQTMLILGTAFIIFLTIIYWDDIMVGNWNFAPVPPRLGHRLSSSGKQNTQTSLCSHLSDNDVFIHHFLEPGICEATDPFAVDSGNQTEEAEKKNILRQEWKVHQTPVAPQLLERQVGF